MPFLCLNDNDLDYKYDIDFVLQLKIITYLTFFY